MELKTIDELKMYLQKKDSICLYGANALCEHFVDAVEQMGMLKKICKIFITNKTIDNDEINGISVVQFHSDEFSEKMPIIITVTKQYQKDIILTLDKDDLEYVILSPDIKEALVREAIKGKQKIIAEMKQRLKESLGKEESDSDILFFTPPYWDAYAPFSAVPCLTAKLKEENYRVKQIDLGILCTWHNLLKNWKKAMRKCMSEQFYMDRVRIYVGNPYETYEQFKAAMWFFHEETYLVNKVKAQYHELNTVQRSVIDEFYYQLYMLDPTDIDFDKCVDIDQAVEEMVPSTFWETLCADEMLDELRCLPKIIGISITSTCQFLPGCALAKVLKEVDPDIKIILGGSCVELLAKSIYPKKKDIMNYFDYIIIGEGETALTSLMRLINSGDENLEQIPNLMLFNDEGNIYYTEQIVEDVSLLPTPDYDGLDLELYLAPKLVLPYQTSRGCHYGQCAFCNHDEKYRHNYRSKPMKKVVEELIEMTKKYHTNYIQFVDEAIRQDCFEEMVNEMDKHEEFRDIKWFYYSRVDRRYNEEILVKAKRNGCDMVMFGVETLNQRLLKFIKKGITAETSKYCLDLFHRCGIKTYAWLMCNLPSESMEEVREDYNEVAKQLRNMDAFSVGPFALVPNTDMYKEPSKYNITFIDKTDPVRFMSHHDGVEVDKDEMLRFYGEEYLGLRNRQFFSGNRYTIFFD